MGHLVFGSFCNPRCRGCSHRGYTPEQSLEQKQAFVSKVLKSWEGAIHQIKTVDDPMRWGYRTSVTLATEWDGERWLFGTKSLDEVIPIPKCPIHHPLVNGVVEILSSILPPDEGFPLAYLSISRAQCTLIVKQKGITQPTWLDSSARNKLQGLGVKGLWIHFNPSAGRRLFEKGGWLNLFGENLSMDSYGLWYGTTAFQQQIQPLYLQTLDVAEKFLMPHSGCAMVDLYCGTGTSLARWAQNDAVCVGVESGGESIECAKLNAPAAHVLRGACRLRIPQVDSWVEAARGDGKQILLYANPPRTGMEPEVLEWIATKGRPERIAYLSCSPGTLSKNLTYLSQHGYTIKAIYPYDFFPNTYHVECLALLSSSV